MWNHFRPFTILIAWIAFAPVAWAQHSTDYNLYKKSHPEEHSVRLNQETTIIVKINKNNLDITQEFLEEDLYLDDAATFGSKRSLNFSTFFELEDIEAASYNFENGKYRETKVEHYKEKDELENSFYDDTKSLNFIFPNLKQGSKSRLKYSEKVNNARFISPFYFGDFSPIINNKVTIIADKDINFRFQEFNTKDLDINFSTTENRGNKIYTWEVKNAQTYDYEENVPTYQNVLPHIIPIITSYKVNGETINLLGEVKDLYGWYYSLVKDINKDLTDSNLVNLVNELTAEKANDLEKVKAIYYWTQQNIKYIDFEYALGGFIPRSANDVYNKKYGDCKDNSSILHKMLEIAGLEGKLTWIGTRNIPYRYEDVPTPIVDNHMILTYKYGGKTYFLDATGRYIPIDFPTSFIQGKEALISQDEKTFIVEEVPVIEARKNAEIDVTTLSLEDGYLKGVSRTEFSGYRKIDYFNHLEAKTNDSKIKEFYNAVLEKGNNKFLIETISETNKFAYDEDFILDYNFQLVDYAKFLGDEIYLNLNLNKEASRFKTKDNRKNAIEFKNRNFYDFTTILEIPETYTIGFLPASLTMDNEFLSASITYDSSNGKITYNHQLELKFLGLSVAEQKIVNGYIKDIEKAYKEIVILKKIK